MGKIFEGYRNYRICKNKNVPMEYFRKWLVEKWKADLFLLSRCIIMFPFVPLVIIALLAHGVVFILDRIPLLIPDSWKIPEPYVYRKKQWEVNKEVVAYLKKREKNV